MTLTLEVLPALSGDAILVRYGNGPKPHTILIDAGFVSTARKIMARLEELDTDVDLFVITHVDGDHVGGAVALMEEPAFVRRVKAIWFNGFAHLDEFSPLLGPVQGERLTELILASGLPWNEGWPWRRNPAGHPAHIGGAVVVDGLPPRVDLVGGATATVVSPTPANLRALLPVWEKAVKAAGLTPGAGAPAPLAAVGGPTLLGAPTLAELAASPFRGDPTKANGSSIAFLLEVPGDDSGSRLLLTGDAHVNSVLSSLNQIVPRGSRLDVDAVKLSHHGSRNNTSSAFAKLVRSSRWLVSSNGSVKYGHPNSETLARVIVNQSEPVIYANYRSPVMTAFVETYPPGENGYRVRLPPAGKEGITVKLR